MAKVTFRLALAVMFGLCMILALGCGDEDKSTERRYCEKMQSCNYLGAGMTVDSCTEIVGKKWNLLVSSQKQDCVNAFNRCLGMADCTNFYNCSVPTTCF